MAFGPMHKNRSVDVHNFAMVPRADIPRASFRIQKAYKTTFDASMLVPIYCEEVLPGDTFRVKATMFARMSTPIFPVMDNLHLESFFFFVPCRLVWSTWKKFMGEQSNPTDSISFVLPTVQSAVAGFPVGGLYDYFGLPTVGQVAGGVQVTVNSLPLRAYNLIYNEWFRDENLINSRPVSLGDGPDAVADFVMQRRGKRHDYFTSALPWPQKGNTAVTLPLGSKAMVKGQFVTVDSAGNNPMDMQAVSGATTVRMEANSAYTGDIYARGSFGGQDLYADLSTATAASINQIRQAFQIQKLLERDARGGTRYTEIIRAHFGVISPDARLQRPEYLGGGSTPVVINANLQTSATGVTGGSTPAGSLSGVGTALAVNHGYSQSFTEHGYVIGLVNVRADLTYQQGLRKLWSRSTRYDFYFPAFAMLGEQAVSSREIFCDGSAGDSDVFGYQERWAEYRYSPSQITGLFRSTSAGTLDPWHLSQRFSVRPTLGQTFIEENVPLSRVLAVGAGANGAQFIFDSFFDTVAARPMPLYSVPGLIDHF